MTDDSFLKLKKREKIDISIIYIIIYIILILIVASIFKNCHLSSVIAELQIDELMLKIDPIDNRNFVNCK